MNHQAVIFITIVVVQSFMWGALIIAGFVRARQLLQAKRVFAKKNVSLHVMHYDDVFSNNLKRMQFVFGKDSEKEVVRLAVALLHHAAEAQKGGWHVGVFDDDDKIIKRILLPSPGASSHD